MTTADLRPHAIRREVYGTITVTAVLIVYDGWGKVTMLDAIVVIVGPVLAMYIGHCFAASLAGEAAHGRPLTWGEQLATARAESGFLLLAVPPLVVLVVLTTAGVALSDAIRVVIWVSAASLGFWGGFVARRTGSGGWRVARGVLGGLLVGGVVLALQVFLQPGEAVSNGVAATGGRPQSRCSTSTQRKIGPESASSGPIQPKGYCSSSASATSIATASAETIAPVAVATRTVPTIGAIAVSTPRTSSASTPASAAGPRFNR